MRHQHPQSDRILSETGWAKPPPPKQQLLSNRRAILKYVVISVRNPVARHPDVRPGSSDRTAREPLAFPPRKASFQSLASPPRPHGSPPHSPLTGNRKGKKEVSFSALIHCDLLSRIAIQSYDPVFFSDCEADLQISHHFGFPFVVDGSERLLLIQEFDFF